MVDLSRSLRRGISRPAPSLPARLARRLRRWLPRQLPALARSAQTLQTSTALIGLAAVLVVVIAAAAGGLLWHLRAMAIQDAERQLRSLNRVLAEQTARSLTHVDFVLKTLAERIMTTRAASLQDDDALAVRMRELISGLPQIRTIMATDAGGNMTESSLGERSFVGDRPHFIAQRDTRLSEPFISTPIVTRLDRKVAISVSRRIERPDGSFDGIVETSLDPAYFIDIYRDIGLGKTSAIVLFRTDGACLIQYPDLGGHTPFDHRAGAPFLGGAPSGFYRAVDPRSQVERLISFHRVAGLPLITVLSVTLDGVLKEWRHEVRLVLIGAAVCAAVLCLLIFLLAKQVRRRDVLTSALRRNEERFRNFAEASSDWFWEQDANLRFTWLSNSVFARSGLAAGNHLGKTRQEVVTEGVSPEQWRRHQADLDARRPFRDFRFQRMGPDGTIRHISISGRPVFDGAGAFRGYSGNARDITGEIAAEHRLREAKLEAEAASRAKGEFLALISHELRTPLNAIIGFSDLIHREMLGAIGVARYREYAGDILAAGRHLLELINDVLDMSKIEARRMALSEGEIALRDLAESCIKIVERQAANGGIRLETALAPDLPPVVADEMRLKQIVLNLLSNAIKFTPEGGHVALSAGRLEDGRLEIAVSDTGIGMSAEETRLALQPFRQIESAIARKHEGTGLGLPLVKAFVELHGGTLELASRAGEGTVARVLLPASRVCPPVAHVRPIQGEAELPR